MVFSADFNITTERIILLIDRQLNTANSILGIGVWIVICYLRKTGSVFATLFFSQIANRKTDPYPVLQRNGVRIVKLIEDWINLA